MARATPAMVLDEGRSKLKRKAEHEKKESLEEQVRVYLWNFCKTVFGSSYQLPSCFGSKMQYVWVWIEKSNFRINHIHNYFINLFSEYWGQTKGNQCWSCWDIKVFSTLILTASLKKTIWVDRSVHLNCATLVPCWLPWPFCSLMWHPCSIKTSFLKVIFHRSMFDSVLKSYAVFFFRLGKEEVTAPRLIHWPRCSYKLFIVKITL